MPTFGARSRRELATAHPDLQIVFNEVIRHVDCSVLQGHRNEEEQNLMVENGVSELNWPLSDHNHFPSYAVDVVPYPIDWKDIGRFQHLSSIVMNVAISKGIRIYWGGYWLSLKDYPHYGLIQGA